MIALKTIVVIMGLMILAGLTLLGAIIVGRVAHRPPAAAPALPPFAAAPIRLPAGAQIERLSTTTDRLVIEVALPDGNRQIIVVDLATGRRLGTIPIGIGR